MDEEKRNRGIMPQLSGSFDEVTKKVVKPMNNTPTNIKPQKALYEGKLPIGNLELECAVLSDGTRVLSESAIHRTFESQRGGRVERELPKIGRTKLPRFLASSTLIPFISNKLASGISKPIKYSRVKGGTANGIPAEMLTEICNVLLEARRAGVLTGAQEQIAMQAEIVIQAFANIGIIALIDEATGFQIHRGKDALRLLVAHYLAEGLQKWTKMFQDDFFEGLDSLYGNPSTESNKRPQYYGKFINTYVYNPLESGYVKAELNKRNITDQGKRAARFHQWLSLEGKTVLASRIGFITGLIAAAKGNLELFKQLANPHLKVSVAPNLLLSLEESEDEE